MSARPHDQLRRWLIEDGDLSPAELVERLRSSAPGTSAADAGRRVQQTLERIDGFGALTPLLASEEVNDICINGPGEVLVDVEGAWHSSGITLTEVDLDLLVERLLAPSGRRLDRLHPTVDARLADGSRLHVAISPVAPQGPLVTIRRFPRRVIELERFGDAATARRLRAALADRLNIVVSGATGAGKTSLISALVDELPADERLVVIEDTAELQLNSMSAVRLEAQPALGELHQPVTLRDLVRNALRMRPDRMVVGEVRGPEALDLLVALNSGHRGALATCHGIGGGAVLDRLAVLAQLDSTAAPSAIEAMIHSGVDLVAHVSREGPDRMVTFLDISDWNGS
ncbi:MAG: CpaF family protein [Acidimicrobiales bacterium]|nr:CpaF family protein [Acidimicrobiales bacterium]